MKPFLLFVVCISLLLLGCSKVQPQPEKNITLEMKKVWVTFRPVNVSILAEKADTREKIDQGLMFRDSLGEKEGMFFYLSYNAYHPFWMFNTKIPLEIIFLNENFSIIDIIEMDPCSDSGNETRMPNCTIYFSKWPALYAIEVNQNFSKKYGIKEGDIAEVR